MDKTQILHQAIEKAVKNGYGVLGDEACLELCQFRITKDLEVVVWEREYTDEGSMIFSYNDIIFSHNFAKAFWGEGTEEEMKHRYGVKPAWAYHLQQMVLEEDPITYLEKFL